MSVSIEDNFTTFNALANSVCMTNCEKLLDVECQNKKCVVKTLIANADYHYLMGWYNLLQHDLQKISKYFVVEVVNKD